VAITDSASPQITVNSPESATANVNAGLGIPTIIASNAVLDQGQDQTFTANIPAAEGGTPPYIYNVVVYNSISGNAVSSDQIASASDSNVISFIQGPQATSWLMS
jgi:hypothetical protein